MCSMDENAMTRRDQAFSFVLPFVVLIVVPVLLSVLSTDYSLGWESDPVISITLILLGFAFIFSGITLLVVCIRLFSRIGQGTLAPWAPAQKLVVEGPYRRTRSPMISGVLIVLLGESILFSSLAIFSWFVLAWAMNHIYFIKSEEPALLARFGDDYRVYKENVPRWIPRRTPWYPETNHEGD